MLLKYIIQKVAALWILVNIKIHVTLDFERDPSAETECLGVGVGGFGYIWTEPGSFPQIIMLICAKHVLHIYCKDVGDRSINLVI